MITRQAFYLIILLFFHDSAFGEDSKQGDDAVLKTQLDRIATLSASGLRTEEMTQQYLAYFSKDPTVLPSGQKALQGREAIVDFYNAAFGGVEILRNDYRDVIVLVQGDMAIRRYIGTAVIKLPDEPESISVTNRYLDVLLKDNGEWKIKWHSWTPAIWIPEDAT